MPHRTAALLAALALGLSACSGGGPSAPTAPGGDPGPTTSAAAPTTGTSDVPAETGPPGTVPGPVAGSDSLGDPYYPGLGNGGYDVTHYDLVLDITPPATLDGVATITAVATLPLASFSLDLVGLVVARVEVDGAVARHARDGNELRVTPARDIAIGEEFTVTVAYGGTPDTGRLDSAALDNGWVVTRGVSYVISEPDAARTWFPANDHPTDKATFSYSLTVPDGLVAVAPGTAGDPTTAGGLTTYRYRLDHPTSTYLATVVIGEFARVDGGSVAGVALRDYLPPSLVAEPPTAFGKTADVIDALDDVFGPFPYDEYGHVVVPGLPGAMENPTLSIVGRSAMYDAVVVHEIAHQWFGDSVTPATWRDIWLNEGFATYAEWLWLELTVGPGAARASIEAAHREMALRSDPPPGDPGPGDLFSPTVYLRGGLTLHALRAEIGDDAFFTTLRAYADRYAGGTASTADFVSIAETVSGQDLAALFEAWLFDPALPPLPD